MKLVTFTRGDAHPQSYEYAGPPEAGPQQSPDARLGVLAGNSVIDLASASDGIIPSAMTAFLEGGEQLWRQARSIAAKAPGDAVIALGDVRLKSPVPEPASLKDFTAYEEHAKAGAARRGETLSAHWYELPAYYKGNPRATYGPDDEIPWPYYTEKFDFECEIACVIGKKGKNIPPEKAQDYIFGYMIFNDFSARDIQKKEMTIRLGLNKGKDFANAFGPYLLTADEVDPAKDFSMRSSVNGECWSQGHFRDNHWGFPLMVSYVSQEEEIRPGDVLGSGTYYKGCGLDLNRWLKPGDVIELKVEKLGTLKNKIGRPAAARELNYGALRKPALSNSDGAHR
ncbi:MAG: fumarylacetoacetate hydrolase family protein [Elusimicrobia bacterium]|nr:fumarylacetoacetate hydrolase family protein [Elusimicrobiota bacterium]